MRNSGGEAKESPHTHDPRFQEPWKKDAIEKLCHSPYRNPATGREKETSDEWVTDCDGDSGPRHLVAGREEGNETGAVAVAPLSGGGERREREAMWSSRCLRGWRSVNLKEEEEGKRKINPRAIPVPG